MPRRSGGIERALGEPRGYDPHAARRRYFAAIARLALLEEQLSSGELADHWRLLAECCRAEDPVMRDIPRHLQKIAQSVSFP